MPEVRTPLPRRQEAGVNETGAELALGEGDTVSWSVPETGETGTVNASFITSGATRITIARDGLESSPSEMKRPFIAFRSAAILP